MANIVTLAWSGGQVGLFLGLGLIVCAITLATWAMSRSRTPLVGDDHH